MNSAELKELRKRFHWSQEEAANRLGCSKRSISNWEKGTHKIPDSIALAAAAVCMNIPKYGGAGPTINVYVSGNNNAPDVRRAAGQGAREALAALKDKK